jgi:hypothetical protein
MNQPTSEELMNQATADRLRFIASTRDGALNYLRNIEKNDISGKKEVWVMVCFDGAPESVEVFWSEQRVPSLRYGGRHAEHVLCENFPQLIALHGRLPHRVSIYLSRSPCHRGHQTPSESCIINGRQYGAGCTAKLITLIRSNPKVESWRIRYDRVFAPGGGVGTRPSETGIDEIRGLNREPNPATTSGQYNVDICELRSARDIVFGSFWD